MHQIQLLTKTTMEKIVTVTMIRRNKQRSILINDNTINVEAVEKLVSMNVPVLILDKCVSLLVAYRNLKNNCS